MEEVALRSSGADGLPVLLLLLKHLLLQLLLLLLLLLLLNLLLSLYGLGFRPVDNVFLQEILKGEVSLYH